MKSIKKNAIANAIRQVSSVAFPLITFPYVSRVIGVESYGKFNFSNSIVQYAVMCGMLGIVNYAVREGSRIRDDKKAFNNFASEIFTINLIAILISYIILFITVFIYQKLHPYTTLIFILSIQVFTSLIGVDWIITIEEDYIYSTIRQIIVQLISLILIFVFVHEETDLYAYTVIIVFSSGCNSIFNYLRSRKYVQIQLTLNRTLINHVRHILLIFVCTISSTIYVSSDITMLGVLKGDYEVGLYSVSTKIYSIVKQLIGAVLIVFVPRLSYYLGTNNESLYKEFLDRIVNGSCAVIFPIMVGLIMVSDKVILFVAGNEYYDAYHSLQILSVAIIFAVFASIVTTHIMLPMKLDNYLMLVTGMSAVTNILLNVFLIPKYGIIGASVTTVIAEGMMTLVGFYLVRKTYVLHLSYILSYLTGCIAIVLFCLIMNLILSNIILNLIISVLGSIILYFSILLLLKNPIMMDIVQKLKKKLGT